RHHSASATKTTKRKKRSRKPRRRRAGLGPRHKVSPWSPRMQGPELAETLEMLF
ncbi:hypothetical protein AK812_SmicGene48224, partial [Symbiodinium microadriaticum]